MGTLGIYLVLAVTTAPPLVPNAGLLVAAGVLASRGSLNIVVVLLVVAGSAILGDLAIHWTGRRFRRPVHAWARRTERRRALLAWTTQRIHTYGIPFVIAVRFLPSGRLVGGLAAGITGYPARRYLIGATVAESIWATYSVFLGYLGSAVAENRVLAAGIGFAISSAVAGVAALVQRATRGGRPPAGDGLPVPDTDGEGAEGAEGADDGPRRREGRGHPTGEQGGDPAEGPAPDPGPASGNGDGAGGGNRTAAPDAGRRHRRARGPGPLGIGGRNEAGK